MSRLFKAIFGGILSLIIVGSLVLNILEYLTPYRPSEWFGVGENQGETGADNLGTGGGLLTPDEVKGNGIKLASARIAPEAYSEYGIDSKADSAISIAVTIEPDDASDKTITATMKFKNAASTWATGKTVSDFATATVNGLNVAITCKQAFGEQIILMIGTSNPAVTATCTVDYAKRLTVSSDRYSGATFKINPAAGATTKFPNGTSNQYSRWTWDSYTPNTDITTWGKFTIEYTANNYSVGTVENPIKSKQIKVALTSRMKTCFGRGGINGDGVSYFTGTSGSIGKLFDFNNMFAYFRTTANGKSVLDVSKFNVLIRNLNEGYGDLVMTAEYEMTYGGKVTDVKEIEIGAQGVVVTGADTSEGGVIL